jgi:hypothetical protein
MEALVLALVLATSVNSSDDDPYISERLVMTIVTCKKRELTSQEQLIGL